MPSNSAVLIPPSEVHDYPGFISDPTALDTFILTNLAASLYAYNKLGEPSLTGPYLDSSGNGRTASKYSGYGYPTALVPSCAPITAKADPSIRLGNNSLQIPTPYTNLGDTSGGQYTISFLMMIEQEIGSGSAAAQANGSSFFSQGSGTASNVRLGYSNLYSPVFDLTGISGQYCGGSTFWVPGSANLNVPLAVVFVGTSVPGIVWSWDVWVNGSRIIGGGRRNGGSVSLPLILGRGSDTTVPFLGLRVSNVASWTAVLSDRQIIDLTECYLDKAAFALAPRP